MCCHGLISADRTCPGTQEHSLTASGLGKALFKALSNIENYEEKGPIARLTEAETVSSLKRLETMNSALKEMTTPSTVSHRWKCQDCGTPGEAGTSEPDHCSDKSGKWSFYWGCCNCALDKHGWSTYESGACQQCRHRKAAGKCSQTPSTLTSVLELRAAAARNVVMYAERSVVTALATARVNVTETVKSTRIEADENTAALIDYSKRVWKISNWWRSPPQAVERGSKPKLLIVYSDTGDPSHASTKYLLLY